MPNWCVGSLKVRGTKENLTKFILEGLHPVGYLGESKGKLSLNKYGDVKSDFTCWIKGTHRGFVESVDAYLSEIYDGETDIVVFDSKFAWSFDAQQLLQVCNKFNVDMKIHAFERGAEFNQVIEIVDGNILKDEKLHFDNYQWDCICPKLGG